MHSPASTVEVVSTLEDAARRALRLTGEAEPGPGLRHDASELAAKLGPQRRLLRALYSGGTVRIRGGYCSRPVSVPSCTGWPGHGAGGRSCSRASTSCPTSAPTSSRSAVPHPMIDPSGRIDHLAPALEDPATAVILLDVVIGHGAARDPAGAVASALAGRRAPDAPVVIGFVVGTDADPQRRTAQERLLSEAGVVVTQSSTAGEAPRRPP